MSVGLVIRIDCRDYFYINQYRVDKTQSLLEIVRDVIRHKVTHFYTYHPDDIFQKSDILARYWYHGEEGDYFDWDNGWPTMPERLDDDVWNVLTDNNYE